jgi:predicted aspartyl protease
MGHVYIEATIRAKRKRKTRFLVDPGATCSLISPELAKQAGMEPSRLREKVHLANGKSVQVPTALGQIRIASRIFEDTGLFIVCGVLDRSEG